tara:strand:- start:846 stop:1799 length:954 start_codon:yes stop_codon:yes gene_type:complete
MKILANDGISITGVKTLKAAGFDVSTENVPQDNLIDHLNENKTEVLLVRSATVVRKDLIDSCPNIKIIGRGGVGMDNIDVEYARSKEIKVINTPSASSSSVAELVFSHIFSGIRFLHDSNRNMPLQGETNFKSLKKSYSNGFEIRGKTIGIVGFGRIGQEVAKIALGLGMNIIAFDNYVKDALISFSLYDGEIIQKKIITNSFNEVLSKSDFITLHVPSQKKYLIDKSHFGLMKNTVGFINCARGGVVNEMDLLEALDNDQISFAGLDTFENEPNPSVKLLMHPKISLSPHIGAATSEAQERIGKELADQIISIYNK